MGAATSYTVTPEQAAAGVIVSGTAFATINLPPAVPGARVTVHAQTVDGKAVDPDGTTDIIMTLTTAGGHRITNTIGAAANDSVTLVCPQRGLWFTESMIGDWISLGS